MEIKTALIILFAIAALIILAKLISGKRGGGTDHNYEKAEFMSAAERSFFGVLKLSVSNEYEIFSKVRIADVLKPKGTGKNRQAALNKIWAKHFDFLLCDPTTLEPKIVIELNDKTHQRKSRRDRDEFVRKICSDAQLTMLEIKASRTYSSDEIRAAITKTL